MTDKKPELSAAMKSKLEPKKFTKNPILGTKSVSYTHLTLPTIVSV